MEKLRTPINREFSVLSTDCCPHQSLEDTAQGLYFCGLPSLLQRACHRGATGKDLGVGGLLGTSVLQWWSSEVQPSLPLPSEACCFTHVPFGTLDPMWKPIKHHSPAAPFPWGRPAHLLVRQTSRQTGPRGWGRKPQAARKCFPVLGVSPGAPFHKREASCSTA